MLDPVALSNFQTGQLDLVSQYFEKQLSQDESFKNKYSKMKKYEGIDFFSAEQFIEFYYDNFLPKVKKAK